MKMLPTALTAQSSNLRVWLTIAPPLEASAPGLGRLCVGVAVPADAAAEDAELALGLPRSKKLVSMPLLSRKALTLTSCDLMVLLRTVVCCAMVEPPRKTTPDNNTASVTQTTASRSGCGSKTS